MRRSSVAVVLAGGVLALLVGALALFQPWRLLTDVEVRSADPFAAPAAAVRAVGGFTGIAHPTSGPARLGTAPDGTTQVFLDELRTDNGPALRVYLSREAADGDAGRHGTAALDLGHLQGNVGDQAYAVPAGTDLTPYRSVVIWCERFGVAFGAAPLDPR